MLAGPAGAAETREIRPAYTLAECLALGLQQAAAARNALRDEQIAGTRIGQVRAQVLPHLGAQDGVFYACGYNGTGVSRASWFGHKIAQRMLGVAEAPSAYSDLPFRTRPLYFGKPWFLPLAVLYYEMLDRWEQR